MNRILLILLLIIAVPSAFANVVKPRNISEKFQVNLAYDGSDNLEYVGKSLEPCLDGEECWQIAKLAYSGSNLIDINYANGTHTFDFEWDERASYTYS